MDSTLLLTGMLWVVLIAQLVFVASSVYVVSVAPRRGIVRSATWLLAGGAGVMLAFSCVATTGATFATAAPGSGGNLVQLGYLLGNVVSTLAMAVIGVAFLLFRSHPTMASPR